jgi:hypothetical protein
VEKYGTDYAGKNVTKQPAKRAKESPEIPSKFFLTACRQPVPFPNPQVGGNSLNNSNVAGTAPNVRHYRFPVFQGNSRTVFGIESASGDINGNNHRQTHV